MNSFKANQSQHKNIQFENAIYTETHHHRSAGRGTCIARLKSLIAASCSFCKLQGSKESHCWYRSKFQIGMTSQVPSNMVDLKRRTTNGQQFVPNGWFKMIWSNRTSIISSYSPTSKGTPTAQKMSTNPITDRSNTHTKHRTSPMTCHPPT